MDFATIRANYPITAQDIYLNHAATTAISNASIIRIQELAAEMRRPLNEHFYPWLGILEDTRRRIAELIHAHPAEIAFCQNTSTGLSLIANAIRFESGDRILVPRNEFPSNIYIWQSLRNKGVQCDFFDVEPGIAVVETLRKLDLKKVRLISISAVSYLTGRQYELKEIAAFCREAGILICYDAIQALGTIPFDIREIQPDFLASGAQKWLLGSVGAGFVYARRDLLDTLAVPLVGWTSVKYPEDFSLKEIDLATDMTRYEPGLPDILPIAALNQSLRDLAAIGWENIYAQIKANTQYLTQGLNAAGIDTMAQHDQSAGIVSFHIPDSLDTDAWLKKLSDAKIHLTQRQDYVRVSPHFYNTVAELDIFLNTLQIKSKIAYPQIKTVQQDIAENKQVLLTGATGILGKAFAHELAQQGYHLTLVGRDNEKLSALVQELSKYPSTTVHTETVDFNNSNDFQDFLARLKSGAQKYTSLINCAGFCEADEFIHLNVASFQTMLQVNCIATFQLMQNFLTHLKADKPLGILNMVSSTGRCGLPLLSGYAASHGALWTLSEVVSRELSHQNQCCVTTYVAPPMHSRLQKRLGRAALRYFKLSGDFPYHHAKDVAKHAWQVLNKQQPIYLNRYNRWSVWINAIMPNIISRKIKKIWKV